MLLVIERGITRVTYMYIANMRKIGQKLWSLSWTKMLTARDTDKTTQRQTDRQTDGDSSDYTRTWLYITFGSLLSQIRLSSVTFVRPTQRVVTFSNISSPLCTLAILWPRNKILLRSFQWNPSIGGVRCKIERWWTYRRLYLIHMSRSGISFPDDFLGRVALVPQRPIVVKLSRGRPVCLSVRTCVRRSVCPVHCGKTADRIRMQFDIIGSCLLYTSDAADE